MEKEDGTKDIPYISLTMSKMTPPARALAIAMSDYSQQVWSAGWLIDLEYILWKWLAGGKQPAIKALSDTAGGWIVWNGCAGDEEGEQFVPMAQWLGMYAKHQEES